jgi:hypothetical protein
LHSTQRETIFTFWASPDEDRGGDTSRSGLSPHSTAATDALFAHWLSLADDLTSALRRA